MKFNTFLLGFVALTVAFSAAFFSVTGLSKLFAGASMAIILMAGSLETAKLVVASYLHNRWKQISKLMRFYLVTAVIVLIGITSAGIYGFLTAAYQTTADELGILDRQVEVIELKKDRFQEQLTGYNEERNQLNQSITNLTEGLANNQIQYTDTLGNVITTTSSATRRALTSQLDDQKEQRTLVRQNIEALTDSVTKLDIQILELQQGNEVAAEIGPLKYLAEITGQPMNRIVNWFALLIIFVFDPLAVSMIISFNHALMLDRNEKKKKKVEEGKSKGYKVYNEGDDDSVKVNDTSPMNPPDKEFTESINSDMDAENLPTTSAPWTYEDSPMVDMSGESIPDEVHVPSVWTDEDLNQDIEYYTESFTDENEISEEDEVELPDEVDTEKEVKNHVNEERQKEFDEQVKKDIEESEKKKSKILTTLKKMFRADQ